MLTTTTDYRSAFLAFDADTLTGDDAPLWNLMFQSTWPGEWVDWMHQRRALGIDAKIGIARDASEQRQCYAVACHVIATVGDPAGQQLRVRACQAIMRGEAKSAWHAVAYALGKLDTCPCYPCTEARKAS